MFSFGWDILDKVAVYTTLFAHGHQWKRFNEEYTLNHGSVPKSAGPYPVKNMERVRQLILPEVARFTETNEGKIKIVLTLLKLHKMHLCLLNIEISTPC